MVSEILKARMNAGLRPECCHYRETRGAELDLMVRGADGWHLVEAKSGQTLNPEFFNHLKSVRAALGEAAVASSHLVYGGAAAQVRFGVMVTPWQAIQKTVWA